jgi:hypothetical protein
MPFAKIVPKIVMQPSSEHTITPEEKKNFPLKTPKSFIVIVINSNPAISLKFNFSQNTTTIVKFPFAIYDLLDGEDGA